MENVNKDFEKPGNRSLTIGLLLENTIDRGGYQTALWQGVADIVEERGANLICFVGDTLGNSPLNKFANAQNAVYELAGHQNVDGLIISGTLGMFINDDAFQMFCKKYSTIPIVSTIKSLPDNPTVLVDNEMGMREMLTHLIQVHGCKRIGFIRGPKNNPDAEQRYEAYRKILNEQNIMFDENIVVNGDFMENSGALAVEVLIDERKAKLDVLIASNDNMARGVLEALRQRGFNVPADLAVVGYDDDSGSRNITPSLTTVSYPTKEQGRTAAKMLFAFLKGEKNIELPILSTKLVVRESCGCLDPIIINANVGLTTKSDTSTEISMEASIPTILNEIREKLPATYVDSILLLVDELLKDFIYDVKKASPGVFLNTLDKALHRVPPAHSNKYLWQEVISSMRRNILPYLSYERTLFYAEDLWHQARVMIAKRTRREEGYRRIQVKKQSEKLDEIGQALMMASDERGIMKILTHWLPWLEISGCYLSLYDDPVTPVEQCRSVLAYQKDVGSIELIPNEKIFPAWQLMPIEVLPKYTPYYLTVEPLYFQEKPFGIIVFELDRESLYGGDVYETLGRQISNSLWRVRLDQYQRSLSERARVIAKVIVQDDLKSALNVIVAGTRDVFSCDAVTLYSYDSGTKKLGHPPAMSLGLFHPERARLLNEVRSDSIVYRMLEQEEPYIVDVIAQDFDFKDRRFVKDEQIKSCVAIPLEVADQKVGVMFVNYRTPHHFTSQEVDDVRLFADQAAAAIRNAQLYDQVTRKARYLQALNYAGMAVTSTLSLDEILERIVEQVHLVTGSNGKPANPIQIGLIEGKKLKKKAWQSDNLHRLQGVISIIDLEHDEVIGIMGRAVITGKSVLCKDVTHDKDYLEYDPRTVSELAVPIILGEKVIGVINAEHPDYAAFDQADQQYLESLATQVAIAIQNAQQFDELKEMDKKKTEFLSTVSHELRTPLTYVQGSVEILLSEIDGSLNKKQRERLDMALTGAREESRLVANLLDLARIQEGKESLHINHENLVKIIQDVVRVFQYDTADKGITLKEDFLISKSLKVYVDTNKIKDVLNNLIGNALKFTPEGGTITISTLKSDNSVEVQVRDNGIGIPESEFGKIFDIFYQVNNSLTRNLGGTGIGLSIVKKFVEMHGGQLWVESQVGEGSTFKFTIPLRKKPRSKKQ